MFVSGAGAFGPPLKAVPWLVRTAGVGAPLGAGQLVLSGALGPMVAAAAGKSHAATIDGLGSVTHIFASIPHGEDAVAACRKGVVSP